MDALGPPEPRQPSSESGGKCENYYWKMWKIFLELQMSFQNILQSLGLRQGPTYGL